MLRIVSAKASMIAQIKCGPAPSIIGIGPRNIMAPILNVPGRTDAITMKIVPINMRRKLNRNSLKGVDHGGTSNLGVSCLRP